MFGIRGLSPASLCHLPPPSKDLRQVPHRGQSRVGSIQGPLLEQVHGRVLEVGLLGRGSGCVFGGIRRWLACFVLPERPQPPVQFREQFPLPDQRFFYAFTVFVLHFQLVVAQHLLREPPLLPDPLAPRKTEDARHLERRKLSLRLERPTLIVIQRLLVPRKIVAVPAEPLGCRDPVQDVVDEFVAETAAEHPLVDATVLPCQIRRVE